MAANYTNQLNVNMLTSITSDTKGLEGPALSARQKSIINNAIRELLHAIGYTGPFRDNDMRVAMTVEKAISHLQGPDAFTSEHETLAPVGAPVAPVIENIHAILEKGISDELRVPESSLAVVEPIVRKPKTTEN